jgi:DNA-binding MurR/RpiR family transcriptional regulator
MPNYTAAQAAEKLGLSAASVRRLAALLGCQKWGYDWQISERDLARMRNRNGRGRSMLWGHKKGQKLA